MSTDTRPTTMLGVKVPPETADALRAHAKARGKSVSRVIRDLIDTMLKEFEL